MVWRRTVLLAFVASLAGCSDSTGPEGPKPLVGGRLSVAGWEQSDTIEATLARPLLATLVDSAGRPRPNVLVFFLYEAGPAPVTSVTFRVGTQGWRENGSGMTDAEGKVAASVRLGDRAGLVRVKVRALAEDTLDEVAFELRVEPGAPVNIAAVPSDSALYVGSSYSLAIHPADRKGNAHATPAPGATLVPLDDEVNVSSGGTVTGTSEGRARVQITAGSRYDTAWVSVVPRGTLALASEAAGPLYPRPGLFILEMDGSGLRELGPTITVEATPQWHPSGDFLAITGPHRVSDSGTLSAFPGVPNSDGFWPEFSADGTSLYYHGSDATYPFPVIWRAPVNGGTRTQITDFWCRTPTPSPDGTRLICVRDEEDRLVMIDIATGDSAHFTSGGAARWSPDGQWIAYLGRTAGATDHLMLIRPDGTGQRVLAAEPFMSGFDWSPDGRYLIAKAGWRGRIVLIRIGDGQIIPLPPFAQYFQQPTWRP